MEYKHVSVMLQEVIDGLNLKKGQTLIDCTLGGGGYTSAALKLVGKTGRVLSIDLDELALANARHLFEKFDNVYLKQGNFSEIKELVAEEFGAEIKVDAVMFDLGLSSAQLDDDLRGFSFKKDGPLDMSFAGASEKTIELINYATARELTRIIADYGEEKFAFKIANAIVVARANDRINTTGKLVEIISKAVPPFYRFDKRLHFATRTFQAFRIATNDELDSLKKALTSAVDILKPGGRIAVVSFHSLEDRIVKHFFRTESTGCICPPKQFGCTCDHEAKLKVISKRAILPSEAEVLKNARARSAKLRIAEKV